MTERPPEGEPTDGTPDFHWLYGGDSAPEPEATRAVPREPRPDETRVMPTMSRPSSSADAPAGSTAAPQRTGVPPTPPPLAPTPGSQPPRRRRGFRFYLRIVLVLLLLWVAYLVAVPLLAWRQVESVEFEPSGNRPAEQPGTTYLMVGSDSRAGLSKAERKKLSTGNVATDRGRTDTIMLLHTGSGPNLLLSIPRDSIVDIPGHGSGKKINAAYAYGGPKLLTKTIEQNTGIRVDKYVEIGLGGLAGVVDAVGGIQICPTANMKDKLAGLNIKKGCQEVDGVTALAYARSRHTSSIGDIDRIKHQREVVAAVGDDVLSPWTFINPIRYWRLWHAVPDFFAFGEGMGPFQAGRWALAMTNIDLSCVVPISDLAVNWDPRRSKQMFSYIKQDKTADLPKGLCTPTGLPKSVTG